jgi:hypothetical protein
VDEDFAQDLSPKDKALVLATQGPLQGAIFGTPITSAAWHTKQSWFVIAANDRAIAPEQEKATAKRMGSKTLTLESSHVVILAKPKEVADFVAAAGNKVGLRSERGARQSLALLQFRTTSPTSDLAVSRKLRARQKKFPLR